MLSLSDTVLLDMVYGEANISLFLNTCVHETGMENGRIKWVEGLQLASERKFRFESRTYIDCSGDGIVGYQAGALFRWGERRSMNTRKNWLLNWRTITPWAIRFCFKPVK